MKNTELRDEIGSIQKNIEKITKEQADFQKYERTYEALIAEVSPVRRSSSTAACQQARYTELRAFGSGLTTACLV